MASGWTAKGCYEMFNMFLKNGTEPTTFYMALVTSATVPDSTTNTLADLTEIAAGNGYTSGGAALPRSSSGFSALTEDDTNHWGLATLADISWTANGGTIPPSGSAATHAAMTDDNATVSARKVYNFFDLGGSTTATTGQTILLSGLTLKAPAV